jgi:glutamate-1-semialdehyde 2,1-aminomutase
MGSTRLPGKVLMDLGGKPVLQWVIEAAQKVRAVDDVIVATPDREIADWCNKQDTEWFLGMERDVLQRVYLCAKRNKADIIVRLTGDCPLLDPMVIAKVVALRVRSRTHYASNVAPPTYPDGLDCEAMTIAALQEANAAYDTNAYDREHVTPWIRRNFRCASLLNPAGDQSRIKCSVDTLEDLERVRGQIREVA